MRSFASTHWPAAVLIAVSCAVIAACQGLNPLAVAETGAQRYYAVYGSYVATEELVADLVDPASRVPDRAKRSLIAAHEATVPVVDDARKAYGEFEKARAEFEAGRIDKAAFDVVLDNLATWVERADKLVTDLRAARRAAVNPVP